VIYLDRLLRASVVVEHGGELWIVPRRPGGWASRQPLTMTPEAQAERLRPARSISPGWLGISTSNQREDGPTTNERPTG